MKITLSASRPRAAALLLLVLAAVSLMVSGQRPVRADGSPGVGDPCLVGTWSAERYTMPLNLDGTSLELTGGAGAINTIDGTGLDTLDYSDSAPLVGRYGRGVLQAFLGGSATNQVLADPGAQMLTITSLNSDVGVRYHYGDTWSIGFLVPSAETSAVPYSCTSHTLVLGGGALSFHRTEP